MSVCENFSTDRVFLEYSPSTCVISASVFVFFFFSLFFSFFKYKIAVGYPSITTCQEQLIHTNNVQQFRSCLRFFIQRVYYQRGEKDERFQNREACINNEILLI